MVEYNRVCELRYIYERLPHEPAFGKVIVIFTLRRGNLLANLKVTRVKWRGVGWKFCRRDIIRKLADALPRRAIKL